MVSRNKKKEGRSKWIFLRSNTFQSLLVGIIFILLAFAIIQNGAAPKKYDLKLWDKSPYDILAPRDIENTIKTEENARAAADNVTPIMKNLYNVPMDVLYSANNFLSKIVEIRDGISKNLQEQNITKKDWNYAELLEAEQVKAIEKLRTEAEKYNVSLYDEQLKYLIVNAADEQLELLKNNLNEIIKNAMLKDITRENLASVINDAQDEIQETDLNKELKDFGSAILRVMLKPNREVDYELTKQRQEEAYKNALRNKVIIPKDSRIISYGDIVTEDKLKILEDLNLLETGRFDYPFAAGILIILLLLALLLVLYMNNFCKKILSNRNDVILLAVVMLLTILLARVANVYSPLLIPIFIAPMLISILIDLKLAVVVNFVLTIAISFITKGETGFIYMAVISGTLSAFMVSRANQRSKLSAAGLAVAGINIIVTICMGVINKSGVKDVLENCLFATINGIVSGIFTIGILPFMETTFNIITPLKLLELANPNQPLMKKLLMEAPGTYHHSLMVGNLAEVATEAIEGNALLARVGAYYHDIGKLKRPNFFVENQLSDNPHDRMTPSLSTLVITSHTQDGIELAKNYKLPQAIIDIIAQHHGNTLVAFFYHKAKKLDKSDTVKQDDFRYSGPTPSTKEAAVVMLADSVEAAVRAMPDKTEGKIEGLIRKIIKDKLDDGQLDLCSLTLKDLDLIAKSFMRVFSGYFHEREVYPEIKPLVNNKANYEIIYQDDVQEKVSGERRAVCENLNREPAGQS
ncbi:MAG TPA: HDIG domain-containing protein [Clostridiaceae bacterium]|nr:HDIG domain-containing protein [Clostridiaceae bacterium]